MCEYYLEEKRWGGTVICIFAERRLICQSESSRSLSSYLILLYIEFQPSLQRFITNKESSNSYINKMAFICATGQKGVFFLVWRKAVPVSLLELNFPHHRVLLQKQSWLMSLIIRLSQVIGLIMTDCQTTNLI